jgi:catechol 2,3-dioxygenase-like lactoylglutathione lyase family enzyme
MPSRRRISQGPQSLAHIALVRDDDEAIAWFTGKLGFALVADQYQPEQDKRWVLVAPPGGGEDAATLLLARAATPEQAAFIGNQAGGRRAMLSALAAAHGEAGACVPLRRSPLHPLVRQAAPCFPHIATGSRSRTRSG